MASKSLTPGTIVITATEAGTGPAVFRLTAAKGAATKVSAGGTFATPIGIAVDGKGAILVADADAFGGQGGVIRVDPGTGAQTTVSSGGLFSNPFDVTVEANGSILVADPHANGTGGVVRVNPDTGEQKMLSTAQEPAGSPALLP